MKKIELLFFAFCGIFALVAPSVRKSTYSRKFADWALDLFGCFSHFVLSPILVIYVVHFILESYVPKVHGMIQGTFLNSMVLYFVVDYSWYWNHRLFHADTPLWKLHRVHHSSQRMDVFISSRNSVITFLLWSYLWVIGICSYLLSDPLYFYGLTAFGSIVIFWEHTSFNFSKNSTLDRIISAIFVTPREHTWHHSRERSNCNFGSVFSFWDRIHGSYFRPEYEPKAIGIEETLPLKNQLFWPFLDG